MDILKLALAALNLNSNIEIHKLQKDQTELKKDMDLNSNIEIHKWYKRVLSSYLAIKFKF